MAKPPDWLEKFVADGMKRELDFEEAVWRSIPAFVTATGLVGALMAYLFAHLAGAENDALHQVSMTLTILGMVCIATSLGFLGCAVEGRRHRYPSDEVATVADVLKALDAGASSPFADEDAARRYCLEELAKSASHNHGVNAAKFEARTRAARWLLRAAGFALAASVTVAISDARHLRSPDDRQAAPAVATPATSAIAPVSAPAAVGGEGGY